MSSLERRIGAAESRATSRKSTRPPRPPVPENIIDFATNPLFLGLRLYPVQALLLKLITLSAHLLTDYDREVLPKLTDFMVERDDRRTAYVGTRGVSPDWESRIERCTDAGLSSFTEVALVLGRRGGKGFIAAILVAWRIWNLLMQENPQVQLGMSPGKALHIPVIGSSSRQAKRDAFGDIQFLLASSPCFAPYLGSCSDKEVTLLTPAQFTKGATVGKTQGLIRVSAHPTTDSAVRGLAAPVLVLDEFAHQDGAGSTSDGSTIYKAARPAASQFEDAMILQTSSPWEKDGQFYATYLAGLELDPTSEEPVHPKIFVAQLESWTMYQDWEMAASTPMWPGGPNFPALDRAIITEASLAPQLLMDPESYLVEYAGQWASSGNRYLPKWKMAFAPYNGAVLEQQEVGLLGSVYAMHCDPSRSGANYGLAIGHLEWDDLGFPHVIFDVLRVWRPQDFPGNTVDYVEVVEEIWSYITKFPLSDVTFDQWNSAGAIDTLRKRIRETHLPRKPQVHERTATAPHNWRSAEIYKTANSLGLIHAPRHELAELELEHLQLVGQRVDHPTTGPVRTKDLADAMFGVVYSLLSGHEALFEQLASLQLHASGPGLRGQQQQERQDPREGLSGFGQSRRDFRRQQLGRGPARGRRFFS